MSSRNSSRSRLAAVLRTSGDLITVDDAVAALSVSRSVAAKALARWAQQHWVKRLRRGLYAPIPLALSPDEQVLEDPWTLVPELFDPAYVGGASAAHYWGLTEQLFRTVFVYTARPVRRAEQVIQETVFQVRHIQSNLIFGTKAIWRGRAKIQVSDSHRTMIDVLDDPSSGGGIRHVEDCLRAYFAHKDADIHRLIEYGDRLGNGAVFKRLGFIGERLNAPPELLSACIERLTSGNAKLDPELESPRLVRRWRLRIPDLWKGGHRHDRQE
ncbi:MAG: type IV toxin-antitoxin system AbiEi family antitoxin domain-containing protein [Acidobacteriaceae bacterium]